MWVFPVVLDHLASSHIFSMLVWMRVETLGQILPEYLISGSTMNLTILFAVTYLTALTLAVVYFISVST